MSDIAIIGDKDSIWAFKAFGFALYTLRKVDEARGALAEAMKKNHTIIFITEDVFKECREEIEAVQNLTVPAIIVIPNVKGSQGIGKTEIQKAIRTAIGAEIL